MGAGSSMATADAAAADGSVGLVHDYLLVMRGAERTFAAMAGIWPRARIYSTLYDPVGTEHRFDGRDVRTSFLQATGVRQQGFRRLLPLFPIAVARLPVAQHDVIVSSSSAFAHGVRPRAGAVHVCYCYSPFRYAHHERATALAEVSRAIRPAARLALDAVRRWDLRAAARVTHYVAISELTKERIRELYGREAAVVHPPVEVDRFQARADPEEEFLIVCELVRHKRVDLALAAARRAGRRVVVVGTGPERAALEARFGDVARFAGRVDDVELAGLYARARALIVPNVEEFGIAAVEAQAAGRPVVGVDAGGLRETVLPGVTGVLVPQGEDAFAEALRDVDFASFDPVAARANAQRFSVDAFQRRFAAEVAAAAARA